MRAATQRIFLSTLSLRRATAPAQRSTLKESDFYPRSPCGERLFHFNHTILIQCISIHALLAESDATAAPGITACHIISIHALLAESDQSRVVSRQTVQRFLSTLSLRRATYAPLWYNYSIAHFYPRSPCGERRHCCSRHNCLSHYFYPRSPCGERPIAGRITSNGTKISIHALLAESDICTLMVQL